MYFYTHTDFLLSEIHSIEYPKYQKQLAFEFLRDSKGTTAHIKCNSDKSPRSSVFSCYSAIPHDRKEVQIKQLQPA